MPASEAQIRANKANSALSTGPRTIVGKANSKANSLKHGLTGEGVVLPAEVADEVERTSRALEAEMRPSGTTGRVLVRRIAICMVRMERSVLQETAALGARVLEAEAEAEREGLDPVEAGRRALFDPSKEATLARKYEAAAERGMYKAMKEFRQVERESKASSTVSQAPAALPKLGSFLPAETERPAVAPTAVKAAVPAPSTPPRTPSTARSTAAQAVFSVLDPLPKPSGSFDLPFSIGRATGSAR